MSDQNEVKKEVLVVSMLNDQTTEPSSKRYIKNAEKTLKFIQDNIESGNIKHDHLMVVDYAGSINTKWNNLSNKFSGSAIKMEVKTDDWISVDNVIRLDEVDGGVKEVNAEDLDFILPPEQYNLTFCGIDLFGSMTTAMKKLAQNYTTRVYVDASHIYGNSLHTVLKEAGVRRRYINFKPELKKGPKNGTKRKG